MKKVIDVEESSFAFKIDDYYLRNTTVPTGLMVDTGAAAHIIKDAKKLKNYNQTFQPENNNIKLADRTVNSRVALKRENDEKSVFLILLSWQPERQLEHYSIFFYNI